MGSLAILTSVSWIFLSASIDAAKLARNCNPKFNDYPRCYRDAFTKPYPDQSFPVPDDAMKKRIESAVNDCFKQAGCSSSPIPTSQQSRDRADCYTKTKQILIGQLNQCVKSSITDFQMPDDPYDPNTDWSYRVTSVRNALNTPKPFCPDNSGPRKQQLSSCIAGRASYDFGKRPPNKTPSPRQCSVDAQCWSRWGTDCQNTWEFQIEPFLCQCSQDLQKKKAFNVKSVQDQYTNCLKARGQTPVRDDPVYKWADTYVRGLCNNANNHPCKKERDQTRSTIRSG